MIEQFFWEAIKASFEFDIYRFADEGYPKNYF